MHTRGHFLHEIKKYRVLLLMLLPATVYTVIFSYLPMSGIVLAFKDYNYADGIFNSPWSGFQNFSFFFQSGQAFKVKRNTVLYNAVFIVINLIMQVGVAVLLSEVKGKRFRKVTQSIMFLPYFISWVVVSMIAFGFLSYDYGILNSLLTKLGMAKFNFYGNASASSICF